MLLPLVQKLFLLHCKYLQSSLFDLPKPSLGIPVPCLLPLNYKMVNMNAYRVRKKLCNRDGVLRGLGTSSGCGEHFLDRKG